MGPIMCFEFDDGRPRLGFRLASVSLMDSSEQSLLMTLTLTLTLTPNPGTDEMLAMPSLMRPQVRVRVV